MPTIEIGCAGFSYDDWRDSFYPSYLKKEQFLAYYAKYFSIVETNSTHYMLPKSTTLKKWANMVPEKFKFCIKIWNQVSHIKDYDIGIQNLYHFLDATNEISNKISWYLLQFPPSFKSSKKHIHYIQDLLAVFGPKIQVAVELRDNSWFDPAILKPLLNGKNQILSTVYLNSILPYYPDWQKHYYIRVIGDRSLSKFNKVQRDIPEIWTHLSSFLGNHMQATDIVDIFVIFNNHYSGFSPEDANKLKKNLGLPLKDYSTRKNIMDFF